jgi:hypothetical protein
VPTISDSENISTINRMDVVIASGTTRSIARASLSTQFMRADGHTT